MFKRKASWLAARCFGIGHMKISLKKNIFFCLFITTIVVLAVYQYCDANKNRCYPYPLDGTDQLYRISNDSFVTLKDLYTSGHVKWIPKDIQTVEEKGVSQDVNDFIKFTSSLNPGKKPHEQNLSVTSHEAKNFKDGEDAETEVARYKKEAFRLKEPKNEATVINKQERELRRFERVDRLIDDHDDEDDNTIERLRTMKSNKKPYDHRHRKNYLAKANAGNVNVLEVQFTPFLKSEAKKSSRFHENINASIKTPPNSHFSKHSQIPFETKPKNRITTPGMTMDGNKVTPTKELLKVKKVHLPLTSSQNFSKSRPAIPSKDNQRDEDDEALMKEIMNNTNTTAHGGSTLMKDIILGKIKHLLPGGKKEPIVGQTHSTTMSTNIANDTKLLSVNHKSSDRGTSPSRLDYLLNLSPQGKTGANETEGSKSNYYNNKIGVIPTNLTSRKFPVPLNRVINDDEGSHDNKGIYDASKVGTNGTSLHVLRTNEVVRVDYEDSEDATLTKRKEIDGLVSETQKESTKETLSTDQGAVASKRDGVAEEQNVGGEQEQVGEKISGFEDESGEESGSGVITEGKSEDLRKLMNSKGKMNRSQNAKKVNSTLRLEKNASTIPEMYVSSTQIPVMEKRLNSVIKKDSKRFSEGLDSASKDLTKNPIEKNSQTKAKETKIEKKKKREKIKTQARKFR